MVRELRIAEGYDSKNPPPPLIATGNTEDLPPRPKHPSAETPHVTGDKTRPFPPVDNDDSNGETAMLPDSRPRQESEDEPAADVEFEPAPVKPPPAVRPPKKHKKKPKFHEEPDWSQPKRGRLLAASTLLGVLLAAGGGGWYAMTHLHPRPDPPSLTPAADRARSNGSSPRGNMTTLSCNWQVRARNSRTCGNKPCSRSVWKNGSSQACRESRRDISAMS